MKLYTRQGDNGTTILCGGGHVDKTDVRVAACGDIDELNSHIGLLMALMRPSRDADRLAAVQATLFHAATHLPESAGLSAVRVAKADIDALETDIDRLQRDTPQPQTFVLPGGCREAAQCHVCRSVCRRAERSVVALAGYYEVDACILAYLNRLSDYFFSLALNLNFISHIEEKKLHISCK